MNLSATPKIGIRSLVVGFAVFAALLACAAESRANVSGSKRSGLGIIKGFVKDQSGNPIAEAYVVITNAGTSRIVKQVRSAANGSFLAKVLPGTYKILAVAQGFNPYVISEAEVNRSGEFIYRFQLERAGSGNTLPEKKTDRNSSKWSIRASAIRNSVYQNVEGSTPVDDGSVADAEAERNGDKRSSQTIVETFGASRDGESFGGVNFATLIPLNERSEIVLAGQATTGRRSPQRFEARYTVRPNDSHQLRVNTSVGRIGSIEVDGAEKPVGQLSIQATDEWRVKNGVILVLGFDYSRFMGAGNDFSITPRFGLQYDVNSRTRVRAGFTGQTDDRSWTKAIELEGSTVLMPDPVAVADIVVENNKPRLNRSSRFEVGVERILDQSSTVEANAFFDLTNSRGVGLTSVPFEFTVGDFDEFVANQQGRSTGLRVVYSRRLNGILSTSAGYAFGSGQKLSEKALSSPGKAFEDALFQTFFGQIDAALRSGTQVKTIYRLSSEATVFAIDPFRGRMMIFDPGLSVVVTQSLPTLGLPIKAEAVLDARNLLDVQSRVNGDEGSLRLSSQRRVLSGGISVRF